MLMSSPSCTHLLCSAAAAVPLIPRGASVLQLSCAAGGAVPRRRRRRSGRLEVVHADSAEVATPAADAAYTTDSLILYFKAEGTMEERAIPNITQALEAVEGVSDLEVLIEEGIGSVVLTKETTVQATGVASNLVEAIQGAGFKLQTLSLSFEDFDENDAAAAPAAAAGAGADDQASE